MISIDRISFEFAMNDESFAHSLYADWDNFCHTCVENIVEECLSEYDKDRVLHEIEKLDLGLGSILQEDFYLEFPRRLREEMQKALPRLKLGHPYGEDVKSVDSRFANLLYYLKHGVLKTEWADIDFDFSEELDRVTRQDKSYLEKIAALCMANEYALRRLLLQTDHDALLVRLYSTTMDRMFSVKDGKRRFMELFLEMHPDVPLCFVRETEEDGRIHGMAELLDTRSVRRIMEKETAEHAEVDLPPYWHYLYEWLIKYYPFNGIAIFGGKSNFIGHLHYRLLTFISKRNNTFYLSKTELTAAFLLEVFGAVYCKKVLNVIYNMQPRNADGSPAHEGYYNRELYRIFMQLSLLYLPKDMDDPTDEAVSKEKTISLLTDFRMEDLSAVLKDAGRSDADKRMVIVALVQQKSGAFISWLKIEATDAVLMTILARLIDERILKQLLASISLVAMETVDEVIRYLTGLFREGMLSERVTYETFALAVREAVLLWIKGNGYALSTIESNKFLLHLIHKKTTDVTGKNIEATVEKWAEGLHLLESDTKALETLYGQESDTIKEIIQRLGILLKAENIPETVKRRVLVSFLERHKDGIADVIRELHEQGLLESAISRIGVSSAEAIIRQMIIRSIGTGEADKLLLLLDRLFANENRVSAYLQNKSPTPKTQVLAWLEDMEMATYISTEVLLDVVGKTDTKQALLLSQTIDFLQKERGRFAFLSNMTLSFTTALSEALLLFMQDNDTLGGRNLTEQEVIEKFLSRLYYVYTRRTDYNDNKEWKHLQDEVTNGVGLNGTDMTSCSISEDVISEKLLSEYGCLDDTEFVKRISNIADTTMLRRMLSWISTMDWKRQNVQQMTLFFLARLYGSNNAIGLPLEMLADDALPEEVRKRMFRNYMRSHPSDLLIYMQRLASQSKLPLYNWAEWTNLSEWLQLVASVSITLEELLRQVIEYLLSQNQPMNDEAALRYGLATFLATNDTARFAYYIDKLEVVRTFVLSLPAIQKKTVKEKKESVNQIIKEMNITLEEEKILENCQEQNLEIAFVRNAGLCLLSPWFPRLFSMLGYLDEEKINFKDTASKIRAVFLLEYLASPEERDYREPELAFNRLLVALPAQVPLPKQIELTDEEKRTSDGMLEGVKANWAQMNGTSVNGFRQSFIVRNGQLEQQDEKWQLTVESSPYDILLESVPWAFRQIRFPWLKKYIQVAWHDKQAF